ncbi:hypothetical protein [Niveispirillum sp.]|uniref:hypothetical protein n=1 Tax=Niveispirillum sp. TaxID=1917217 RepID=UPI001B5D5CFE|nr:hypothetical protein [Niveispirillum sp.]MBP7340536.1 hypothetical protein [Niveispirillum sp.]
MDIKELLAARTRWQPAPTVSGTSGTAKTAGTSTDGIGTGGEVGLDGADTGKTTQTGGLTGTNHSMVDGLPALELPSRESVEADRQQLGDELRMTLAMAGIKSDPPLAFSTDASGQVKVEGDDPRAAAVNDVLSREPDLQNRLRKLVSDAQMLEHADAVQGYYQQVNAGGNAEAASTRLVEAGRQIDAAKGFTLAGEGLTLECDGMGKALMPPEPTQVSDEERMWREMLRLTDRTRQSGVVAAAEDAAEAEKKDKDTRQQDNRKGAEEGAQASSAAADKARMKGSEQAMAAA